jgi:hypothetical protein
MFSHFPGNWKNCVILSGARQGGRSRNPALSEAEGDLPFCFSAKNAKHFYRIRRHGWQCATSLQAEAASDFSAAA